MTEKHTAIAWSMGNHWYMEIISMNRNKMLGLILSMDMASKNRKRSGNMAALYGKKRCASCEYWSGVGHLMPVPSVQSAAQMRTDCATIQRHHFTKEKPRLITAAVPNGKSGASLQK